MAIRTLARRLSSAFFAALLAVISVALLAGGAELIKLGGSPYYLVAGLLVGAAAAMQWRRSLWADRLYAVMLVGSLAWALFEAGLAPWALAPRLLGPAVLGLAFFLHRRTGKSPIARL